MGASGVYSFLQPDTLDRASVECCETDHFASDALHGRARLARDDNAPLLTVRMRPRRQRGAGGTWSCARARFRADRHRGPGAERRHLRPVGGALRSRQCGLADCRERVEWSSDAPNIRAGAARICHDQRAAATGRRMLRRVHHRRTAIAFSRRRKRSRNGRHTTGRANALSLSARGYQAARSRSNSSILRGGTGREKTNPCANAHPISRSRFA